MDNYGLIFVFIRKNKKSNSKRVAFLKNFIYIKEKNNESISIRRQWAIRTKHKKSY